jgi:hypothetical protein
MQKSQKPKRYSKAERTNMRKLQFIFFVFTIAAIILTGILAGCSSKPTYPLAAVDSLPLEIRNAAQVVLEAYQFAVANPGTLEQIPCYCGCGDMGHTSNYSCYVREYAEDGALIFDNHALGCSVCVEITQDTMRLLEDGKSLTEIRAYVDATYAQYGPSNIPAEQQ